MIIETSINPNLGWFFRDSKLPVLNYQFPVFVRYNFTINETARITYHTFGIKLPDYSKLAISQKNDNNWQFVDMMPSKILFRIAFLLAGLVTDSYDNSCL